MQRILFILLMVISLADHAQNWELMENEYNSLLKNKQNDLALIKAKEIYSWVKMNESDTSIHLPISLKLIGNSFQAFNKDSSITYYDKGLQELFRQNRRNHIQVAKIYNNKSNIYNEKGLSNLSMDEAKKALSVLKENKYSEYPFCTWPAYRLAELYRSKGNIDSVKYFNYLIKHIITKNTQDIGYIKAALDISNLYKNSIMKNDSALLYANKVSDYVKKQKIKDTTQFYELYNQLGYIYWSTGEYIRATQNFEVYQKYSKKINIEQYKQVELNLIYLYLNDLNDKINFKKHIAIMDNFCAELYGKNSYNYSYSFLGSISSIYFEAGLFKESLESAEKQLIIYNQTKGNDLKLLLSIKNNIGINSLNLNNLSKAKASFIDLKNDYELNKLGYTDGYSNVISNLALCYKDEGELDSAVFILKTFCDNYNKLSNNNPDIYYKNINTIGEYYSLLGKSELSISNFKSVINYYEGGLKFENINYQRALENTAIKYLNNVDYENSIVLNKKLIRIYYNKNGILNNETYINKLLYVADLYTALVKFDSTKWYLDLTKNIIEKNHPSIHKLNAYFLNIQGNYYGKQGKWFEADNNYSNAIKIYEELNDTLNSSYLQCLKKKAAHELIFGNKLLGKKLSEKRIKITVFNDGIKSTSYYLAKIDYLNNLDYFISKDSLKVLFENCLSDIKQVYGEMSPIYLKCLQFYVGDCGNSLTSSDRYKYIIKVIGLSEQLKIDKWGLYNNYEKLVYFYIESNQIDSALFSWSSLLNKIDRTDGKASSIYKEYYSRYANDLITQLNQARKGLDILIKELKVLENKDYSKYRTIQAGYLKLGQFENAKQIADEYLLYIQNYYGANTNEYLDALGILINYYSAIDDYGNIIKVAESRYLLSKYLSPNDLEKQTNYLRFLITSYCNIGNFEYADEIILKVFNEFNIKIEDIITSNSNINELLFYYTCNKMLLKSYGKSDISDVDLERLISKTKLLCNDHSEFCNFINFQLDFYSSVENKNFEKFNINNFLNFIKKMEDKGEDASGFYQSVYLYYNEKDDYQSALKYAIKSKEISSIYTVFRSFNKDKSADSILIIYEKKNINKFLSNYLFLNENLQLKAKEKLNTDLAWFYNRTLFESQSKYVSNGEQYNLILNTHGKVSSSKSKIMKEFKESSDSVFIKNYDTWLKLYKKISAGTTNLFDFKNANISNQSLTDSIDQIEKVLYQTSTYKNNTYKWVNYTDVKKKLKPNEALVHVYRLPKYDYNQEEFSDSIVYLFFILKPEISEPEIVIVKNGKELEEDEFLNYASYTFGKNKLFKDESSFDNYYLFLEKHLIDKTNIFVISDGVYNKINLANLYQPSSNSYLSDKIKFNYINSTESILNYKSGFIGAKKSVILIGNPKFLINNLKDTTSESSIASRDFNTDSLSRGMNISALPGTKAEVETIDSLFKLKKWTTSVFSEENASEQLLKKISSPHILHIATHGFFLDDDKTKPKLPQDNQLFALSLPKPKPSNPLLKSGLILSGAKNYINEHVHYKGEDGILSAYEASFLNLENTELVVLSACETGRGKVVNGEGIYGLRKALFDAGAKNLIISLWKVDDKVTKEFMESFYSNLLITNSLEKSFYDTQNAIKLKYPQPYYWSAFILVK